MPADADLLYAEVDRQLSEVRAAADGVATRSGLLVGAAGVAGAVFAPRIQAGHHQSLLVVTLTAFAVTILAGAIALMPWLKTGPRPIWLAAWIVRPSARTSAELNDDKIAILDSNLRRLQTIRTFFAIQAATTLVAVGLALWYSAWK